jgi:predicted PurR-regulated permease PerM
LIWERTQSKTRSSALARTVARLSGAVLALLAALYVAREIVLPVVPAFTLNLLLQPALRMLELRFS